MNHFFEILFAPALYTDMLWILIPLVASVVLMELYFGRHRKEQLGWNSVFGNAIVLIFVSLDLFRRLHNEGILGIADFRNLLAIGIFLEGIVLTLVSFFHLLPRNLAFEIGAKLPTSLIAYMAVVLVYGNFKIGFLTVVYALTIIIVLTLLLGSFRSIVPEEVEINPEEVEEAPSPKS